MLSVSGCPDTETPAKSYQPETDAALLKRAAEDPTVPVQDVFLALRSLQKAKLPVRGRPCTPEISSLANNARSVGGAKSLFYQHLPQAEGWEPIIGGGDYWKLVFNAGMTPPPCTLPTVQSWPCRKQLRGSAYLQQCFKDQGPGRRSSHSKAKKTGTQRNHLDVQSATDSARLEKPPELKGLVTSTPYRSCTYRMRRQRIVFSTGQHLQKKEPNTVLRLGRSTQRY